MGDNTHTNMGQQTLHEGFIHKISKLKLSHFKSYRKHKKSDAPMQAPTSIKALSCTVERIQSLIEAFSTSRSSFSTCLEYCRRSTP